MGFLLIGCGVAAALYGSWRSYLAAREALAPLVHEGEPTRTAIEAARPLHSRSRVRRFARGVALAVGWLLIGTYGVFLISVGMATP
jgi:hypothetical protein